MRKAFAKLVGELCIGKSLAESYLNRLERTSMCGCVQRFYVVAELRVISANFMACRRSMPRLTAEPRSASKLGSWKFAGIRPIPVVGERV
jgi:hypothetical protein